MGFSFKIPPPAPRCLLRPRILSFHGMVTSPPAKRKSFCPAAQVVLGHKKRDGGDLSFAQNASSSSSRNRLAFVLCPAPNISPLAAQKKKPPFAPGHWWTWTAQLAAAPSTRPARLTVPPPFLVPPSTISCSDEDSSTTAPKKDASLFFIFVQLFGRHHGTTTRPEYSFIIFGFLAAAVQSAVRTC